MGLLANVRQRRRRLAFESGLYPRVLRHSDFPVAALAPTRPSARRHDENRLAWPVFAYPGGRDPFRCRSVLCASARCLVGSDLGCRRRMAVVRLAALALGASG